MPRRAVAIAIEGIGITNTAAATYAEGGALFYGMTPTQASGNFEWVNALTELPDSIDTHVNPLTGKYTISSFTFQLRRTDALAKALLFHATRTAYTLSADLTAAATTLSITPATGFNSNGHIWIGDEAIHFTTNSGSTLTGLTRGYYGTAATKHATGDFIYDKQNSVRFRRVILMTVDDTDARVERWQGVIDTVGTNDPGTRIVVTVREAFAVMADMVLNEAAPDMLDGAPDVFLYAPEPDADGNYAEAPEIRGVIDITNDKIPNGRKSRVFKTVDVEDTYTAFQVGQALTVGFCNGGFWEFNGFPAYMGSVFELNEKGRGVSQEVQGLRGLGVRQNNSLLAIEGEVYEVAIVSKAMDNALASAVSFTRDMPYPYHPLTIATVLLMGDDDDTGDTASYAVLEGRHFCGKMRGLAQNNAVATIDALILATVEMEVDYFGPLGWDGQPEHLFETVTALLRLYGFFLTFDEEGEWSISRFSLIDVSEWDSALSNDIKVVKGTDEAPLLKWDSAYDATFSAITAEVGELPWQSPRRILVRVDGSSERANKQGNRNSMTYKYNTVNRANALGLAAMLTNIGVLLYFAMPRFTVWTEDSEIDSLDYSMGAVTSFQSPLAIKRGSDSVAWLVGNDGELTTAADGVQFAGRIVGRLFNIEDHRYRLSLVLSNYRLGAFIRWRAPSLVCDGWVDNGDGTYDIECAATGNFGQAGDDADYFTNGDDIEVFDRSGARDVTVGIAGVWPVTTGTEKLVGTGGPSVDVTGLIVRLAQYTTGGYSNTAIFTNIDRAYSCFGNDDFDVLVDDGGFSEAGDHYG